MANNKNKNLTENPIETAAEMGLETGWEHERNKLPKRVKRAIAASDPTRWIGKIPPFADPVRLIKKVPPLLDPVRLVKAIRAKSDQRLPIGPRLYKLGKSIGEESIQELSINTLASYLDKAGKDLIATGHSIDVMRSNTNTRKFPKSLSLRLYNRASGIVRASKQFKQKLKEEDLNELSKATLTRYIAKAFDKRQSYLDTASRINSAKYRKEPWVKDHSQAYLDLANKRNAGMNMARKKIAKMNNVYPIRKNKTINELSNPTIANYIVKRVGVGLAQQGKRLNVKPYGDGMAVGDGTKIAKIETMMRMRIPGAMRKMDNTLNGVHRGVQRLMGYSVRKRDIGDVLTGRPEDHWRVQKTSDELEAAGVRAGLLDPERMKGIRVHLKKVAPPDQYDESTKPLNEISARLAARYLARRGAVFIDAHKRQITFPSDQMAHLERRAKEAEHNAMARGFAKPNELEHIRVHNKTMKATNQAMRKVFDKFSQTSRTAGDVNNRVRDVLIDAERERIQHALLVGKSPTIRMQVKAFAHKPTTAPESELHKPKFKEVRKKEQERAENKMPPIHHIEDGVPLQHHVISNEGRVLHSGTRESALKFAHNLSGGASRKALTVVQTNHPKVKPNARLSAEEIKILVKQTKKHDMNEGTINELSVDLLKRYVNAAGQSHIAMRRARDLIVRRAGFGSKISTKHLDHQIAKREVGQMVAHAKAADGPKMGVRTEPGEFTREVRAAHFSMRPFLPDVKEEKLDELSKATIANYAVKRFGISAVEAGKKLVVVPGFESLEKIRTQSLATNQPSHFMKAFHNHRRAIQRLGGMKTHQSNADIGFAAKTMHTDKFVRAVGKHTEKAAIDNKLLDPKYMEYLRQAHAAGYLKKEETLHEINKLTLLKYLSRAHGSIKSLEDKGREMAMKGRIGVQVPYKDVANNERRIVNRMTGTHVAINRLAGAKPGKSLVKLKDRGPEIDEGVLNEVSPQLLARYWGKAYRQAQKQFKDYYLFKDLARRNTPGVTQDMVDRIAFKAKKRANGAVVAGLRIKVAAEGKPWKYGTKVRGKGIMDPSGVDLPENTLHELSSNLLGRYVGKAMTDIKRSAMLIKASKHARASDHSSDSDGGISKLINKTDHTMDKRALGIHKALMTLKSRGLKFQIRKVRLG